MRVILKKFLWILPFVCFITGYWLPYLFFDVGTTKVPHLIGKNVQTALELASQANLSIKLIRTQEDGTLAPGTVLFQTPNALRSIRPHQTILIVTSTQPKPQQVPDCCGMLLEEIVPELKRLGLAYTLIQAPSDLPAKTVIAQEPSAGNVLTDKKLILYVSSSQTHKLIPMCTGKTVCEIYDFFTLHGFTVQAEHGCKESLHTCTCIISEHKPFAGSYVDTTKNPTLYLKAKRLTSRTPSL